MTTENIFKKFGESITYDDIMAVWGDFTPEEKKEISAFLSKKHRDFWNKYADFYTYFFPKLPFVPEHIDHFVKMLDPQDGEIILDLGCGYGRLIEKILLARPTVKKIIGIDYAQRMLDKARKVLSDILYKQVELINYDITKNLPLGNSSVDKVISNWGISYSPRINLEDTILPEIFRVLKPGGFLLISALHKESDMPSLREKMSFINLIKILKVIKQAVRFGKEVKIYFPTYSIEELIDIINKSGLKVVKKEITVFNNSVTILAQK